MVDRSLFFGGGGGGWGEDERTIVVSWTEQVNQDQQQQTKPILKLPKQAKPTNPQFSNYRDKPN